jgi:XTP/dITP diphosphohydrolase
MGECKGKIIDAPQGKNGFGYDPIFVPFGYDKSFAELDNITKNSISHRGKALLQLKDYFEKLFA